MSSYLATLDYTLSDILGCILQSYRLITLSATLPVRNTDIFYEILLDNLKHAIFVFDRKEGTKANVHM